MIDVLIDSAILVDVLRAHGPAMQWLATDVQQKGVTPIAWMELVAGSPNLAAQRNATRLLTQFELVYLVEQDFDWAMEHQLTYQLSHGVGVLDCLIASVSHRLNLPLYTGNLRHFTPLIGALAQKPY